MHTLRLSPALLALGLTSLLLLLPEVRLRTDFELLDEVIKNAGLQRQDIVVFEDILSFRRSSATDGIVVEEGRIVALRLIGSDFDNFQLLTGLDQIVTLNLYGNRLSSLDGVQSLRQLQYLNVESNTISDIAPASDLRSLQEIYFGDNLMSTPIRPVQTGTTYFRLGHANGMRALILEVENLVSSFMDASTVADSSGARRARKMDPTLQSRDGAIFSFVYDFLPGRYQLLLRVKLIKGEKTGDYFTLVVLAPTEEKSFETLLRKGVRRADLSGEGQYEMLKFDWKVDRDARGVNIIAYYHPGPEMLFDTAYLIKTDMTKSEERSFDAILEMTKGETRVYP